ncbi:MAG: hypothetical protein ABEJ42_06680 [Halobacteriaceae archaeon]
MVQTGMLVGAAVMWLVLFGATVAVARARNWRRGTVAAHGGGGGWKRGGAPAEGGLMDRPAGRPLTATFLLIGLGVVVAGVGVAAALTSSADVTGLANTLVVGGLGFLLTVFLVVGTYATARGRGLGSAGATAVAGWVVGLLLLAVVGGRLVLA